MWKMNFYELFLDFTPTNTWNSSSVTVTGVFIVTARPCTHKHTYSQTHTHKHTRDTVSCSEVLLQSASDSRLSADGCDLICLRLPAALHYCFVWKSWLLLLRWWSREQRLRVSAEINMFMFILPLCFFQTKKAFSPSLRRVISRELSDFGQRL